MNKYKLSKIALSHSYWCLNRNQVWVKQHLETILGICFNQMSSVYCLRTIQIPSPKFWTTWKHMLIWLLYTSLCLCKLAGYCIVVEGKSKEQYFSIQFDPGLTGTRKFPRVLDYRDLRLYKEPRMSCDELLFLSFFSLVVPHPIGGSETWSFWVLSILFLIK